LTTTFLALYRGESVAAAKLLALTAEPELVLEFAERMLARPEEQQPDAVLAELGHGRRRALELVKDEAWQASPSRRVDHPPQTERRRTF
jgi:hypothetical protein